MIALPDEQRLEYNAAFEQLYRLVHDLEPKLPFLATMCPEPTAKRLVMVVSIQSIDHTRPTD